MNNAVVSLNVSLPRVVSYRGPEIETGIFNAPTTGPVMSRELNLDVVEISFFDRANLERAKAALRVKALPRNWRLEFAERLAQAGQLDEAQLDDCCGPS